MDVEIEDIESWPPEFRKLTIQSRTLVISHHEERLRIERFYEGDDYLRKKPPKNRYKQACRALVDQLEALLVPQRIIAYHCSRLTKEEIVNIKQEGLHILTADLVNKKLDGCLSHGYLKQAEYEHIRNSPHLFESLHNQLDSRTGMIHFCASRTTLMNSHAVYRFFRSWGGEALYWGHEQDSGLGHVISQMGVPCIVVSAIPFMRINQGYRQLSEHFIRYLFSEELGFTELSLAVDIRTEENLGPSEILDIIEFTDPGFEELTSKSSWSSRYQIKAPVSD